jgi:formamidopyrimidine-DNA glycosylase
MPELPEVEVVRKGLAKHVKNRKISNAKVRNTRALRNFEFSNKTFEKTVAGLTINSVERRGKFLWMTLKNSSQAISAHLGMSGQMLMVKKDEKPANHARVVFNFSDAKRSLHFIDQRTFGWVNLEELVEAKDKRLVPQSVLHISPDLFEDCFNMDETITNIKRRKTGIKQALLNQEIVAGIGNIYADEALWLAKTHWADVCDQLSEKKIKEILISAKEVMSKALEKGGTSFDDLYIDVNGESGYFENELNAYGREGERCYRCDLEMVREAFSNNRSSTICPNCQPRVRPHR